MQTQRIQKSDPAITVRRLLEANAAYAAGAEARLAAAEARRAARKARNARLLAARA